MTHLEEMFDYPLTRKQRRQLERKNRRSGNSSKPQSTPVKNGGLNLKRIVPKTDHQADIFDLFGEDANILAHGYPGTGKTFLFVYLCMNRILNNEEENGRFKKLVIIRSALSTRDLGFMPGNKGEKIAEYEAPYIDIFSKLFGRSDAYSIAKKLGIVEFQPTSFLRGTTLDDCLVIVDEMQNLTAHENASVITRLGDNTRVYFAGDFRQSDHKFKDEKDGVLRFLAIVRNMKSFGCVEMGTDDIVRGPIVKEFIIEAVKQGLM